MMQLNNDTLRQGEYLTLIENDKLKFKREEYTVIYTDGSYRPKNTLTPDKGGAAFLIIPPKGDVKISSFVTWDDNMENIMAELVAIEIALSCYASQHRNEKILIRTDCKSAISMIKNGSKKHKYDEILENINLNMTKLITFKHVKAHNGEEYNDLVDRAAGIKS